MPKNSLVFSGLGSDPEVFLFDWKKGKHVYPGRYIKGTKEEPFIFDDHGRTIQIDVTAAEFTHPPTETAKSFWKEIQTCLKYLESQLPENVTYDIVSSANFDKEELDYDPAASILGCSPDFSGWTCEPNNAPDVPEFLRSAGGHVHIGMKRRDGEELSMVDQCMIIRACDLYWGVASVLIDDNKEARQRRTLYGKAGCCRFHDNRVEYRSLSNFWLSDYEYVEWFFDTIPEIFKFVNSGKAYDLSTDKDNDIVHCINNGDVVLAQRLIERYKIDYPVIHEQKLIAV